MFRWTSLFGVRYDESKARRAKKTVTLNLEGLEDRAMPSVLGPNPSGFEAVASPPSVPFVASLASPAPAPSVATFTSYVFSAVENLFQLVTTAERDFLGDLSLISQEFAQIESSTQQQMGRLFGTNPNAPNPSLHTTVTQSDSGMGRGNSSGSGSGSGTSTTHNSTSQPLNNSTPKSGSGSGSGSSGTTIRSGKTPAVKLHPMTGSGSGSGGGGVTATVIGQVYLDNDGDGYLDNGEMGYYGTTVNLYSCDANGNNAMLVSTMTTTTNPYGNNFKFVVPYNYLPGYFEVWVGVPTNFTATYPGSDSDINTNGFSPVFALNPGGGLGMLAGILSMTVSTTADDANQPIQNQVTLRDAVETGNKGGGPFGLNKITFIPNGTITLQKALEPINRSYDIVGNGASNLTVDGNNSAGTIFTLNAGFTSTISGLTIAGGAGTNGGGILNKGNITLESDAIVDNGATGSGGGIYNDVGAQLDLGMVVNVDDNIAGMAGGGLENYGSVNIYWGVSIYLNTASRGGGGIQNGIGGKITAIHYTQIYENSDALVGGGVSNAGFFVMNHGSITNNTEKGGGAGGGVCNTGGTMSLSYLAIQENKASQGGGIYVIGGKLTLKSDTIGGVAPAIANKAAAGGGLYINGGTVKISKVKFSSNSASGAGGVGKLAGGGGVFVGGGILTLTEVYFGGNKTQTNGGGLFVNGGTVKATGGTFTGNRGMNNASNGGGIYVNGGKLTILGGPLSAAISNNSASAAGAGNGGGIYINGGTVSLSGGAGTGLLIQENGAPNKGGGIYNNAGSLTIKNKVYVESNNAGIQGGGMYLAIGSTTTFPGNALDCSISGNTLPVNTPRTQGWGVYQQTNLPQQAVIINWQPLITVIDREDKSDGTPAQGP